MTSLDPFAPRVSIEVAVLSVGGRGLRVLLGRRSDPPFQGGSELPGDVLAAGEDLHETADRVLRDRLGSDHGTVLRAQLGAYATLGRDPRGRSLSIAHLVVLPEMIAAAAGAPRGETRWEPTLPLLEQPHGLAFDHREILTDAVARLSHALEHTTLAARLCPEEFTLRELCAVYETVWGRVLPYANFRRKVLAAPGYVESLDRTRHEGAGRPSALYRRGPAQRVHPPLLRP